MHAPDGFYLGTRRFALGFFTGILIVFSLIGAYELPPRAYAAIVAEELNTQEANYIDGYITYVKAAREIRNEREATYRTYIRENFGEPAERSLLGYDAVERAQAGKMLVADLDLMRLFIYENGIEHVSVPILSKGKPGTRWETPAGLYSISSKEESHLSTIGDVYMPYSMQFFGNFFIHGWPTYPDGNAVPEGFSGGCIRLSTEDAQRVFGFADPGTPVLVQRTSGGENEQIQVREMKLPKLTAQSYLVADITRGDVFLERRADSQRPIASITKLVTALVSNESISYGKDIAIQPGGVIGSSDYKNIEKGDVFRSEDLIYPLLMESNNAVAHAFSDFYGTNAFTTAMNAKAKALDMKKTRFRDASGISASNVSTAEDLFKLAQYLYENASFVLATTKTEEKTITSQKGTEYHFMNTNHFSHDPAFVGGKTGYTTAAQETMLSLFNVSVGNASTTIAVIVLGSSDRQGDTLKLLSWFREAASVSPQSIEFANVEE